MKNSEKLDQLTSLRFFAALLIVFHHSGGVFGTTAAAISPGQGVSFFFVLSGFILTYVYPRLESGAEIRRFWQARFARIWPAYVLSFVLALWFVPFPFAVHTALAHLAMVQSWIPMSAFYFSYDAAAWSISTEAFFYLAFPFLIKDWERTWKLKALLVLALLVAVLGLPVLFGVENYGDPYLGGGYTVSIHGFAYISPLARLPEFLAGMLAALLWQHAKPAAGTPGELASVFLCLLCMHYTPHLAEVLAPALGEGARVWISQSGSFLAFAVLIYVFAGGRGLISRALRARGFVVLGEISFSLYLLHQILFGILNTHLPKFSGPVTLAIYLPVFLGVSYAVWRCVELPARRALLRLGARRTESGELSWLSR